MTEKYEKQRELAYEKMGGTEAFATLYKDPTGEIGFTFAIDEEEYPSSEEAVTQQTMLLGHHIRHLANRLGSDESKVVELAMEASVGFESS
jgi:hypothetical protein